jgi:hypothetical protein
MSTPEMYPKVQVFGIALISIVEIVANKSHYDRI